MVATADPAVVAALDASLEAFKRTCAELSPAGTDTDVHSEGKCVLQIEACAPHN